MIDSSKNKILIIDDEVEFCKFASLLLDREGFATRLALDGESGLKMIGSEIPDIVLLDYQMPGINGLEVLKQIRQMDLDIAVVMITGHADVPGAVIAMKAGAFDYLAKPFHNTELVLIVHRAINERNLKRKLASVSTRLLLPQSLSERMGPSDAIRKIISEVNHVAKSNYTVIIQGETGTGKELVAHGIHDASLRANCIFVPVDCGAIPETLLESELFGHEKGSFTGAVVQRQGRFELAQGGTLLLDEIFNMSMEAQSKLLRVLQEKLLYRIGGKKSLHVDVRLIAASNRNLEEAVANGTFREDLFYRLNDYMITIPPLRERKEDIVYLAKRFMDITNIELNKKVRGFTETAIEALLLYDWPGNVRQLNSTIRRAVLLADEVVTEKQLQINQGAVCQACPWPAKQTISGKQQTLREIVRKTTEMVERATLVQILKQTDGNKAKAARLLHVDYKTINTKIRQLGITLPGKNNVQEE
ncbi:MAG: sigma-54 dependent transcriptional regulator [Candidatus Electryoneaceae bacterium]|nr:sigma-54 dependent transcriptional regulator [Candidatus Electryoneaceae bacterium]